MTLNDGRPGVRPRIGVDYDADEIQDYIAGRLFGDKLRMFEDRLCKDPVLVREIELFASLQQGLATLRDRGDLTVDRRWRPSQFLQATAAAAAVLVGLAVTLFLRTSMDQPILTATVNGQPGDAADRLIAEYAFGDWRAPDGIVIRPAPNVVMHLKLLPGSVGTHAAYRVELSRVEPTGGHVVVGSVDDLNIGADGFVHCFADPKRVRPGAYELRMRAIGVPRRESIAYSFEIAGSRGSR
jgi:hypothetical protein